MEHHNYNATNRILVKSWNKLFAYYYNTKQELGNLEDLEEDIILTNNIIDVMKNFTNLSDDMVKFIVEHWWYSTGSQQLKQITSNIIKTTGTILRCDHTYGVVNSIGIEIDDKWVYMYISYIYINCLYRCLLKLLY